MKNSWRFIFSGFKDCRTNMAVDEALFLEYARNQCLPVLRIYGWARPAFSLGYAQRAEDELDLEQCRDQGIGFVRRITGGGIIFHHQELTYSLVCSQGDLGLGFSIPESFKRLCSFLLGAYRSLGLKATYAVDDGSWQERREQASSFCFSCRQRYDILINARKIGGNAQRRRRNIIFQHGSIPLRFDTAEVLPFLKRTKKGELESKICDLRGVLGRQIEFNHLAGILRRSFEEEFSTDLREEALSAGEKELAGVLRATKYDDPQWNLGKTKNAHYAEEAVLAE